MAPPPSLRYRPGPVLVVHQYPAFPGHGFVDEIGAGKGQRVHRQCAFASGERRRDILENSLNYFLPIVEFQPDVVAVPAGFDAHQFDLLLDLKASANFFYKVGQELRPLRQYLCYPGRRL